MSLFNIGGLLMAAGVLLYLLWGPPDVWTKRTIRQQEQRQLISAGLIAFGGVLIIIDFLGFVLHV